MFELTWATFDSAINNFIARLTKKPSAVYGIPTGGSFVARALSVILNIPCLDKLPDADFTGSILVVDDLVDSGATIQPYFEKGYNCDAVFRKPHSPQNLCPSSLCVDDWIVFPWEGSQEKSIEDACLRLMEYIGEDPTREGLLETPKRFAKAWQHWTSGYKQNPADVLKVFDDGAEKCDELVLVRDIPIYSHCEHHLAAIFGSAHIGYIPNGKIVGLSKLARIADIFARRLQVQERLTNQIADALEEHLNPLGVGVVIQARHFCMESRGIEKMGSATITSAMRGVFRSNPSARAEFMGLIK